MYDSVTPQVIPKDATAVGGYPHGDFVTWGFLTKTFKHANKLSFGIRTSHTDCACLDCETGDVSPTDFGGIIGWMRDRMRAGHRPKFYASRDNIPPIIAALMKAGIGRSEYDILSAHYATDKSGNHIPHICSPGGCGASFNADGTQWTDRSGGLNLDESLLKDGFFPPAPKRKVIKKPAKPHPKVTAAGLAGAVTTAVLAFANAHGVHITHLTTAETAAITTAAAALAGYFTPGK